MSIGTYNELLTAISNWTKRSDIASGRDAEFVSLGEARIGREVKARQMEARVSTTPDDQYTDLPSDYVSMRAVRIKGSSLGWLTYVTPDKFFQEFASSTSSNRKVYTIFGDELIFPSTPDGDVELWYYKKLAALSSASNSLFTSNPDLYLYAAMSVAMPFMKNVIHMPAWESLYQDVKNSVNKQHWEGRFPAGMAVSRG